MTAPTTDIDDDSLSGIDRIYHHHVHVPVPYHNQEELQYHQQQLQQQHQLEQQQKQIPFLRQFYHPQMDLTFGAGVNPYVGGAGEGGFYFPHGYVTSIILIFSNHGEKRRP